MSDLNICYLTASEALRRFKDRTLSPVELLQAYLARAEEIKDTVNGFTALYAEEALSEARKAEARYAADAGDLRPSKACRRASRTRTISKARSPPLAR
jgi:amidase